VLRECLCLLEVDTKKNETDRPYIAFRNHPIITHSLHEIVCLASCIAHGSQPAPCVNENDIESESVLIDCVRFSIDLERSNGRVSDQPEHR